MVLKSSRGGGGGFAKWKADIKMIMAIMDRGQSFREDNLVEPVVEGDIGPIWHL
jgi:hypothetical protein